MKRKLEVEPEDAEYLIKTLQEKIDKWKEYQAKAKVAVEQIEERIADLKQRIADAKSK